MSFGKSLKSVRERKELSQSNVANDLFVNQTMISKIEKGQRNMSDDLARASSSLYDDAQYGFEVAREISKDYITPLVTAEKAVELHRLALEEVFKREATEAINKFNEVSLVKPPQYVDDTEKEQIAQGIGELLDVQAVMNSFLMRLEQEYGISIKACMRQRTPKWKAMGWIE
ncbi:helix-turn-helix transcriptional regulator [Lentibacillus sp. N15]|uniref:helix-turn-helix transcriptional regulator n=1 Tax=Lentibacillus songyuanensis TaxID=3136161 RepID=UPI0031BB9AF9